MPERHDLPSSAQFDFDMEDVEYLRHGEIPLLAPLFRPRGAGPFPAMIELHGGVWTRNDRTRNRVFDEWLAQHGIAVASLGFRQGPDAHPNSLAELNFAIRWLNANFALLNTREDLFGICGSSSGGHLALLAAIRANDPRYAAIALPDRLIEVDAGLRCLVMFWPVTNPYGRYEYAKELMTESNPPDWPATTMRQSRAYWQSEEHMAEGSPVLILDCGEQVATPPALMIQEVDDPKHDYPELAEGIAGTAAHRFADCYRHAGENLELTYYDAPLNFNTEHPLQPESNDALQRVTTFIHRQLTVTE